MISPAWQFNYQFEVHPMDPSATGWRGQGRALSRWMNVDGLVGPEPRFELSGGWLTLLPTNGWAHSLPIRQFSDQIRLHEMDEAARLAELKRSGDAWRAIDREARSEAEKKASPRRDYERFQQEYEAARERALRRDGQTRDLASYGVFIGDSLNHALRDGDTLNYSRDGNGDYRYSVSRAADGICSAGTVGRSDPGGPIAIWQEHERYPNPDAEELKKHLPAERVGEWIHTHKPYVTARIRDRHFRLLDGDEAKGDGYYIYLARSNRLVPALAFEFEPRAVHAAARLDVLDKEQIIDAAVRLTRPYTQLL